MSTTLTVVDQNCRALLCMRAALAILNDPTQYVDPRDCGYVDAVDAEGAKVYADHWKPFTGYTLREVLLLQIDPEVQAMRDRHKVLVRPARFTPVGAVRWSNLAWKLNEWYLAYRISSRPNLWLPYERGPACSSLRNAIAALMDRHGWSEQAVLELEQVN